MPEVPPWRLDDAAAYDAMREAATLVASRLAAAGNVEAASGVLREAATIDAFDRAEVDGLHRRLANSAATR